LPEDLREELRRPFGELIRGVSLVNIPEGAFVIAIGDIVCANLVKKGILPDVSLFDLKTKRERAPDKVLELLPKPDFFAKNRAGTIGREPVKVLSEAILRSFEDRRVAIEIEGEEDLLAIPGILLAPIPSYVLYGLPDKGLIRVSVSPEKKKEVKKVLEKFG
jgi:uncharacterized protein (UPF0218 family)